MSHNSFFLPPPSCYHCPYQALNVRAKPRANQTMIQQLRPRRLGWVGNQRWSEWKRPMVKLIACLVILSVLYVGQLMFKDVRSLQGLVTIFQQHGPEKRGELKTNPSIVLPPPKPLSEKEKLLSGLLAPGFPQDACLSRYQSINYLKELVFNLSPHLISKLRHYEALHKNCAPFTAAYNTSVEQLKSHKQTSGSPECNYIVWSPRNGLGNRIISLVSAFIYALLTNRVLLVDPEVASLFCEPFPGGSWLLPDNFPLKYQIFRFDGGSVYSYGDMLRQNTTMTSPPPPFAYLHLFHNYDDYDQRFFCDEAQTFLQKVPWLILKSDTYFTVFYFMVPSFQKELGMLFPEKDSIFHLISRYLLHPTNKVWGLATQYYHQYFANADEKIGIQIRIFNAGVWPKQHVVDQIINCTLKENLLPEVNLGEQSSAGKKHKRKAVLVTSLSSRYGDRIRDVYWEKSTKTGEIVDVYQPSHEERQRSYKESHDIKAWTEMYLLSMMDKLVTSASSTFGYVAQGLGGIKPWVLNTPENDVVPSPSCWRDISMEPCFHSPPDKDCNKKKWSETVKLFPFVKPCEDRGWNSKLVDPEK